jgi:hypothetical protein
MFANTATLKLLHYGEGQRSSRDIPSLSLKMASGISVDGDFIK